MNDVGHDLGPFKNAVEILASQMWKKALLNKTTKVAYFRNREPVFVEV